MGTDRFSRFRAIAVFLSSTFILTGASSTNTQLLNNQRILMTSLLFVPGGRLLTGIGTYSLPERVTVNGLNLHAMTGGIYFWSVKDGTLNHFVSFSKEEWPLHFDISPDGTWVAVVFYESLPGDERPHGLGCYSLTEKRWLWKWKWEKDEIEGFPQAVRILPDGRRILVLGYWSIWYYDVKTGQKVHEWKNLLKEYRIWRYAARTSYLSPTGRYLIIWQEKPFEGRVLWGLNRYVTTWDLEVGKQISRWNKPDYESYHAVFSPDERNVIFSCKDGYLREWSIDEPRMTRQLKVNVSQFTWVGPAILSSDGRFLAVKVATEDAVVFDWSRAKRLCTFDGSRKDHTYAMAFSSDGELFAVVINRKICLYSTSTWEQKWCVDPKPPDVLND